MKHPDVLISDQGTLVIFRFITIGSLAWADEWIDAPDHTRIGDRGIAVSHAYAGAIIEGLRDDGFLVDLDRS